jgi:hypothetical protein
MVQIGWDQMIGSLDLVRPVRSLSPDREPNCDLIEPPHAVLSRFADRPWSDGIPLWRRDGSTAGGWFIPVRVHGLHGE